MNNRWIQFGDILISDIPGGYVLSDIAGEGSGTVTKRTINYIDTDGASFADFTFNPRPVEIDGFINAECDKQMIEMKQRLISACYPKKEITVTYFNREKIYTARAMFEQLPVFERRFNYSWNMLFKLYLIIPGFYWNGANAVKKKIFKLKDEVLTSFTLPCVFTSLTKEAALNNSGDIPVLPDYIIKNETPGAESVIITNKKTGQRITLNYALERNEEVRISSQNQTATSDINGNITSAFTIDTEFFELSPGVTEVEAVSPGNNITVEFFENYLGV